MKPLLCAATLILLAAPLASAENPFDDIDSTIPAEPREMGQTDMGNATPPEPQDPVQCYAGHDFGYCDITAGPLWYRIILWGEPPGGTAVPREGGAIPLEAIRYPVACYTKDDFQYFYCDASAAGVWYRVILWGTAPNGTTLTPPLLST